MSELDKKLPKPDSNVYSEHKIGALLTKMGKITASDTDRVLEYLKLKGLRFGEAAKKMGLITERDIQEVLAKQFDYPNIIEQHQFSSRLTALYHTNSQQAEYLRGLRTQLMIDWFKDDRKVLAISGINRICGASMFAANLAIIFAQFGKRTLLIDADLRGPTQHHFFRIDTSPGLSDVLMGRAGQEAFFNGAPLSKFFMLPAGTKPPNPQEIISSQLFKQLIEYLSESYDIILVDTPAFSVGSDAQAIAATVGGSLLVARAHYTKADDVSKVEKTIINSGAQVVGSVLMDF
jgi:receptor protein-tyrosine kinase